MCKIHKSILTIPSFCVLQPRSLRDIDRETLDMISFKLEKRNRKQRILNYMINAISMQSFNMTKRKYI